MKKLVIDVENTTTKLTERHSDYLPYNPNNKLVSIGWMVMEDDKLSAIDYLFVNHNELCVGNEASVKRLREAIKLSEVLIAHNAKYDIQWLEEAGFDLSHLKVEDTMIREYVMARGANIPLRLADTCKRYGVAEKGELFEKYPDLMIDQMPIGEVEEYGRADIQACAELYLAQKQRLELDTYYGLTKTIDMMNEFCRTLATIERNGVKIDEEALNHVEQEFTKEAEQLTYDLNATVKEVMGDTPVNLESPQQVGEVLYSRRIKPDQSDTWVSVFNIGKDDRNKNLKRPKMSFEQFRDNVVAMTQTVMKTDVKKCSVCMGAAQSFKIKKDGTQWKKPTKCKVCSGRGVIYHEINEIAGFKMKPRNVNWTTVNGFSTSQMFLDELMDQARDEGKLDALKFIEKIQRLSSLSSYLSNFVGGIKTFKQADNILHPNFNQTITSTGRLSSTKPNLQNMPREATFPIRAVFVSRFEGGKICEVDFAQLEFRAAVHLAKCEKGKKDILDGIDLHSTTAKIITEAGQPIGRQEAKSRTFKPLYAGSSGTSAEREYYAKFLRDIYTGIGAWHKCLEEEAITKKIVTTETGRQFLFGDVERAWHGGATRKTQIVNYPVQSFATADLVIIATIRLFHEIQKLKLKSIIILNIHDSCVVDVYPGEEAEIARLMSLVGRYAEEELLNRYTIKAFVPFDVEVKIGNNLMEMKKVA